MDIVDAADPVAKPEPESELEPLLCLADVNKALGRRLGVSEAVALAAVTEHVAKSLLPASAELTHKGKFADRFASWQPPHTSRVVRGKAYAAEEEGQEQRVWFLKNTGGAGLSTGVTVHGSRGAALHHADRERRGGGFGCRPPKTRSSRSRRSGLSHLAPTPGYRGQRGKRGLFFEPAVHLRSAQASFTKAWVIFRCGGAYGHSGRVGTCWRRRACHRCSPAWSPTKRT